MENRKLKPETQKQPIVVDLETSLLRPGYFWEGLWALIRKDPLLSFKIPFLFFSKKLSAKVGRILNSEHVVLPIDQEVLDVIRQKKRQGYDVILKHERHSKIAQKLQYKTGCFSDIVSRIPESLKKHGYTYLTTKTMDPTLWQEAHNAIFMKDHKSALTPPQGEKEIEYLELSSKSVFFSALKSLRIHQWAKSTLLFLPLLLTHNLTDISLWLLGFQGFVAFCLVSSAAYVINDLFDLESDRNHKINQSRPFAAGDVPIFVGFFLYFLLLSSGLISSYLMSKEVFSVLSVYVILGHLYTFFLKKIPVVDTILLSSFYVLRIFMGAIVLGLTLSPWVYLMGFSFFFSLANLKRVCELKMKKDSDAFSRRGYLKKDTMVLTAFGVSSAFSTAFFFPLFLYFNSLEKNPLLWGIGLIMVYWFCYMWLITLREAMSADPVKFALKDATSHACLYSALLIWFFSGYFGS